MKIPLKPLSAVALAAGLIGLAPSAFAETTVSRAGTGQALIFPYYSVNGGYITTFNVTNTSNRTVPTRIRFHELKNSRDVLDFVVVLSPRDVWTGALINVDGVPTLQTTDRSCTSPLAVRNNAGGGVKANSLAYTGASDDSGGRGTERMREGYVEVLALAEGPAVAPRPPRNFNANTAFNRNDSLYVPFHSTHVRGEPRDCRIVDRAFIAKAPTEWAENTSPLNAAYWVEGVGQRGSGSPLAALDFQAPRPIFNPLIGNVTWINAATGLASGVAAVAVQDWAHGNLITAQQYPWFLEPTFASGGCTGEACASTLWTVRDVLAFENAVGAANTFNEWSNNEANGAFTDWVVMFPTKAYHVDQFNEVIQAAASKYRNPNVDLGEPLPAVVPMAPVVVGCTANIRDRGNCLPAPLVSQLPVTPFEHLFGVQGRGVDGKGDSVMTVRYNIYDREEGSVTTRTDGTTVSPAPPPDVKIDTLKYEANVISWGGPSVLASGFPITVDASGLLDSNSPYGWASLDFAKTQGGIPVAAFAVKTNQAGASAVGLSTFQNGYTPKLLDSTAAGR